MRTHRKFIRYLYFFLASLIPLIFFIIIVDPKIKFEILQPFLNPPLIFFMLFFASLFTLFTFIFASRRRGILASLFICGIFILRFFGLKSIFQVFILLLIILLIEYIYSQRLIKKSHHGPIHKF